MDSRRALFSCMAAGLLALPSMAHARPACPRTAVLSTLCSTVLDVETDARIRAQLLREGSSDAMAVRVHVSDGVVTLGGSVTSEAERTRIEELVRNVSGVVEVHNGIAVVEPSVSVATL